MSVDRQTAASAAQAALDEHGAGRIFGPSGGSILADYLAIPGPQTDSVGALRAMHSLLASHSPDLATWDRLRANPLLSSYTDETVEWAGATWRALQSGSSVSDVASAHEREEAVSPEAALSSNPAIGDDNTVLPVLQPDLEQATIVHSQGKVVDDPATSLPDERTAVPVDTQLPPPDLTTSKKRSRALLYGAAAFGLIVAAVGGAVYLTRDGSEVTAPATPIPETAVPTASATSLPPPTAAPTATVVPTAQPTATAVPTVTPIPLPTPLPVTPPIRGETAPILGAGVKHVPIAEGVVFTLTEPRPVKQQAGHTLIYLDGEQTAEVDIFTPIATKTGEPLSSLAAVLNHFGVDPNLQQITRLTPTVVAGYPTEVLEGERTTNTLDVAFHTDLRTVNQELAGWYAPQRVRIWLLDTPHGVIGVTAETIFDDQERFIDAVDLATEILDSFVVLDG